MTSKLFRLRFEFLREYREIIPSVDVPTRLPYHGDVILRGGDEMEAFLRVGTPRKIRWPVAMSTMNKQELRRSILGVIRSLLLSDFGNVPKVNSSVRGRRGEHSWVVR